MKLVLVDGGTDVVVEPGFAEKQCVRFYVQVLVSMEVVVCALCALIIFKMFITVIEEIVS